MFCFCLEKLMIKIFCDDKSTSVRVLNARIQHCQSGQTVPGDCFRAMTCHWTIAMDLNTDAHRPSGRRVRCSIRSVNGLSSWFHLRMGFCIDPKFRNWIKGLNRWDLIRIFLHPMKNARFWHHLLVLVASRVWFASFCPYTFYFETTHG